MKRKISDQWELREYEDGNVVYVCIGYKKTLDLWVNSGDRCIAVHFSGHPRSLAGGCEDTVPGMNFEDAAIRAEEMADYWLASDPKGDGDRLNRIAREAPRSMSL